MSRRFQRGPCAWYEYDKITLKSKFLLQVTMADQQAPHRAPRPSRRPRLLLLGHSHIVRLKQYIRRTPDRRLDFGSPVWVDHEGTPGLTVSRAKDNFINLYGEPDALQQMPRRSRLRQMPRRSRPDMVMLFIGDNDVLPRYGPPRYAPSFIIRKIVKLVRFILRYRGIKTVCVLGLLPRVTNTEDPEDRHIEYNRRAAEPTTIFMPRQRTTQGLCSSNIPFTSRPTEPWICAAWKNAACSSVEAKTAARASCTSITLAPTLCLTRIESILQARATTDSTKASNKLSHKS